LTSLPSDPVIDFLRSHIAVSWSLCCFVADSDDVDSASSFTSGSSFSDEETAQTDMLMDDALREDGSVRLRIKIEPAPSESVDGEDSVPGWSSLEPAVDWETDLHSINELYVALQ